MQLLNVIKIVLASVLVLAAHSLLGQVHSNIDSMVPVLPAAGVNKDWRTSLVPNSALAEVPSKTGVGAPLAWQGLRESDLLWKKRVWREISTLEKQNLPFRYAGDEHTGGGMLIEILIDAIRKGKVIPYATGDNRFTTTLTKGEIKELTTSRLDTYYVKDLNDSEIMKVSETEFDPSTVTKYRIIEDWMLDRNTGQMVVRIIGLAPVVDIYGVDKDYRGSKAMFWLYYPNIRGLLAGYEAASPDNDAYRITWDEYFESRRFSSRITKVSNPLGSVSGSYGESFADKDLSPMEALYEGKKGRAGDIQQGA